MFSFRLAIPRTCLQNSVKILFNSDTIVKGFTLLIRENYVEIFDMWRYYSHLSRSSYLIQINIIFFSLEVRIFTCMFFAYKCLWCVLMYVCSYIHSCISREAREWCWVYLFCHFLLYSLKTRLLTKLGATLTDRKPCPYSCI